MAEEDFRRLQAEMERRAHPPSENAEPIDRNRPFTAELKITLDGRDFSLRPDGGLVALFTYVSRGYQEHDSDDARGQASMAAMHALLEASVEAGQWDAFQQHALACKPAVEDVEVCIRQIIEAYTARPYWAGMRLLASAASEMAELDGAVLMGTGRGVASFTAREVCNLQLARILQGMDADTREITIEDIYLDYSPEQVSLDAALRMIADKNRRKAEEEAAGGPQGHAEGDGDSPVEAGAG